MKSKMRKLWIKFLRYLLGITFTKSDIYIIGNNEIEMPMYLFKKMNDPIKEVGEWYDVHVANFYIADIDNELPTKGLGVAHEAARFYEGVTMELKPLTPEGLQEMVNKIRGV